MSELTRDKKAEYLIKFLETESEIFGQEVYWDIEDLVHCIVDSCYEYAVQYREWEKDFDFDKETMHEEDPHPWYLEEPKWIRQLRFFKFGNHKPIPEKY